MQILKSKMFLAALWGTCLLAVGAQASADCAAPAETMDLELASVSLDGVVLDDLSPYKASGRIVAHDTTYIEVELGNRIEWFDDVEVVR